MDIVALMNEAQKYGVSFIPGDGERLKVRAPAAPPDILRQKLKQHKGEILSLLRKLETTPHIDYSGDLRIPLSAPKKYHWWAGGQSIRETLIDLNATEETLKKYETPSGRKDM